MEGRNGTAFRGVSLGQDSRFSDKMKKTMKETVFPPDFDIKVDMKKIQLPVIKSWISKRIEELLGIEDDILIEYIFELLQEEKVDPREIQINLTGFLESQSSVFVEELWKLLISADSNPYGIPQQFLDKEKERLSKQRKVQDKIENEIKSKYEDSRRYSREESPERRRRSQYSPSRRRSRYSRSPTPEKYRRRDYSPHDERYRRRRRSRSNSPKK